jgi:hypothetical protein
VLEPDLPLLKFGLSTPISIGGGSECGGVYESYELLLIETMRIVLQGYGSEWPAVRAFLVWARSNSTTPFDFWFSRADVGTKYSCLLRSPRMPDPIDAEDGSMAGTFRREIVVQATLPGTVFSVNYFGI